MNKYIKLSTPEAFRYFIDHDESLAPEVVTEIRKKNSDKFHGDACVTIVIPTHRIGPDSEMDPIELKKAISEAEMKLHGMLEKRQVWPIAENMREAESTVDHRHNLDSLILYANEYFSAVVKVPMEIERRVFEGSEFDLRPLYKARQQNQSYYILTVSKQLIRLAEARNDKVLTEYDNEDFPFVLNRFYEVRPEKRHVDAWVDNMEKEFYNDADKVFQKYWKENPLPVVLFGDIKSVSYYEEVMDGHYPLIGRIHGNYDKAAAHVLIESAAKEVQNYRENSNRAYLAEIDNAVSGGLLTTDIKDMFSFAEHGRAEKLFLDWNFSPEGRITWNDIEKFNNSAYQKELTPADLLSVLIADVAGNGGEVVFMDRGRLDQYGGIALVRRF